MNKCYGWLERLVAIVFAFYIRFVYLTSKIHINGPIELLNKNHDENYIIGFWHGKSFSFFPLLHGSSLSIITTLNKRGNYISHLCHHFSYLPIRVPDENEGKNFMLQIRRELNGSNSNLAIALDGPLGPLHEIKTFPLITAVFTKRKFIGVDFDCRHKIELKKRWDHYLIPLPFNKIHVKISQPIEVGKEDMNHDFLDKKTLIKQLMNQKGID